MRTHSIVLRRRSDGVRRMAARPRLEMMEGRVLLTVFPVTEVLDASSPGTLRWALDQVNRGSGGDTIAFAIPGTGVKTINLSAALPTITVPVTIDGTTQPGYAGTPLIRLDGSGAGAGSSGLSVVAGATTITGLSIVHFQADAIHLTGASGNIIRGNFLGINPDGITVGSNGGHGLFVASANNTIGGLQANQGNLISANLGYGIALDGASASVIQGNLIGVDGSGTLKRGNSAGGILVRNAPNNLIGGVSGAAGNVISGNGVHGIETFGITDGLLVQGNAIGTDRLHLLNLGNLVDGVRLFSSNNTIGGPAPGAGNTIAYNGNSSLGVGAGVSLILNVLNNQITSNSIYANVGLGINLGGSGNKSQQAPSLGAASTDAGSTVISGTLSGRVPNADFQIQFFTNSTPDDQGFGEGETLLGTQLVRTDGSGNAAFSVSLPSGVAPGAYISATATDPAGNTSQFSRNVSTKGTADLSVALSADPTSAQVGDTITFTLVVTNNGPTVARGVSVVSMLPAGVSLISATAEAGSTSPGPNSITFFFGGLQVGESRTATIVVQTSPSSGASITSSASVNSQEGDPSAGNNTTAVTVPLSPVVDLSVSVQGPPDVVPLGQNVTYLVTVANLGPSAATDVTLTDLLPENVTLVSASATQGTTSIDGRTITTFIPLLNAHSAPVVLTIVVSTNASTLPSITNSATVSASEPDASTENNFASETTSVTPIADLRVSVKSDSNPVLAGQKLTYTVTLTNDGPSTATEISLVDVLPAGVTFVSASDNLGGSIRFEAGAVTDEIASLAPGGVVVLTIVVSATSDSALSLTNTATVASLVDDPNDLNNSATVTTPLNPASDLSVTLTADPAPVGAGQALTYKIKVTNRGPSAATGVRLIDLLPANAKLTSVIVSQGQWSQESDQVIGLLGTLAPDAFATMTIVIETSASHVPSIVNTATVSADLADPMPADNTATATTTVTPRTDLAVTVSPVDGPLLVNRAVTYLVTVTNHGPSLATGVLLTEVLPTGVSFVSATDSRGVVLRAVDGSLVDTIGDLASGESVTLTIVVTTMAPGPFVSSSAVTGNESDDEPLNNTASVATTVVPAADLAVTLVADRDLVTTGDRLTFRLTVTNQGASPASGVILNQAFPLGQAIIVVTTSQGDFSLGSGVLTARLGNLAVGASATLTIVVMPTVAGNGVNQFTVSGRELDPSTADNSATATTVVLEPPGQLQFESASVVVNENAGTASLVVSRTQGRQGRVSVNYSMVLSGTAAPGVDFVPVWGTLVFDQGESTKTITVPVLANPYSKQHGTVTLILSDPQGGAGLGAISATTLTIHDLDPDFAGPTVNEVRLFGPATSIQYVTLIFNEALDPATAWSPAGYQLVDVGADGRFGTTDDRPIPLLPPGYDPANQSVTLRPAAPLQANRFYYVQAAGIRDLAGNLLEAGPGATSANQFGAYLFRGTSLRYYDSRQTLVTAGVTGGGLLDLTRFANGDGDRLQVLRPVPRRTVLSGRVRGGAKSTSFTSITGLGAFGQVRVRMNSPAFRVGHLPFNRRFMAPPAVDGVFGSVTASGKPSGPRLRRPHR